jgi:hypothetical protein
VEGTWNRTSIKFIMHLLCATLYPCGVGAQGNPCTVTISDQFCIPSVLLIVPDSCTRTPWQLPAGEKWQRNGLWIFPTRYLFHTSRVLQHAIKSYDTGPTALLPLWRKSCYRFLLPLKIHGPQLGLNPWILGPIASMLTTTPLRATIKLPW